MIGEDRKDRKERKKIKMKMEMKDVIDNFKELLPSSKREIILDCERIYKKYTYQYRQYEKNEKFLMQLYGKKHQKKQASNEVWIKIKYPKKDIPKYTLQFLEDNGLLDQHVTQDKDPEYKCVNIRMLSDKLKEFILKAEEVCRKEIEINNASQKNENEKKCKYTMTLRDSKKIIINNQECYAAKTPESINFLRSIYKANCCNRKTTRKQIEKKEKTGLKFSTLIYNMGLNKKLQDAFFPDPTEEYVIFNNPIYLSAAVKGFKRTRKKK